MNNILNQIEPAAITALVTILVAIIGYIGKKVAEVVPVLIDHIAAKTDVLTYQQWKAFAQDAWNIVEEFYRLNPIIGDAIAAKVKMFESLIKQKIPGITDAQIEELRQAIAGAVNQGKDPIKAAIENPDTSKAAEPITIDVEGLKAQVNEAVSETVNAILNAALAKVATPAITQSQDSQAVSENK